MNPLDQSRKIVGSGIGVPYTAVDAFSPLLAGLAGINPITGMATSPFPAPTVVARQIDTSTSEGRLVRTAADGGQTLGNPIVDTDIQSQIGERLVAFPHTLPSLSYEIVLNGVFRRVNQFRPFHIYRQIVDLGYTPTYSPIVVTANQFGQHSLTFANTFSVAFNKITNPIPTRTCSHTVTMVLCTPVVISCSGESTDFGFQTSGLNRKRCRIVMDPFTMGGYQDPNIIPMSLDVDWRPHLVIYADETVSSVTANPGGGASQSINPILIGPEPNFFSGQTLNKAFLCNLTGQEESFSFTITSSTSGCNQTVTTPIQNWFTAVGLVPNGVYWWEAYAHCQELNSPP